MDTKASKARIVCVAIFFILQPQRGPVRSVSSPTAMVGGTGQTAGNEGSREQGGGGAKAGTGNVNREQVMIRP